MRLRMDSAAIAGWKRAHELLGCHCVPELNHVFHDERYADVEPAEPGDAWVNGGWSPDSRLAGGYALTCPKVDCAEGVHRWWHAYDCPAGRDPSGECKVGAGRTSCWSWTGSIEANDLTASPSLHVVAERGGCGWHGFLTNGEMSGA